jgi:hypothetical protein
LVLTVKLVANKPIFLFLVSFKAAFAVGSITPIILLSSLETISIIEDVAVLHATTIILAPFDLR